MGLIGLVSASRADLLRQAGVRPGNVAPANELEIFCALCVGRVFYRAENQSLYFVESPNLSISEIIQQVFRGLGEAPRITQHYMDEHRLFRGALSVRLSLRQKAALFAAFALAGISITGTQIPSGVVAAP